MSKVTISTIGFFFFFGKSQKTVSLYLVGLDIGVVAIAKLLGGGGSQSIRKILRT